MKPLLVISSGSQIYREHALQTLAAHYPVVLLNPRPNTWQAPYILDFVQVPLTDQQAVLSAVSELKERYQFGGVFTYDEAFVVETAMVAELLNLPSNSVQTARLCRDKYLMRQTWQNAGVPSARSFLVQSLSEAEEAAEKIGYPVVIKPRGLAASVGVLRVDIPEELPTRYIAANIDPHPFFRAAGGGALVEEYLDGPEVSVECAVMQGHVNVIAITRKQVGLAPGFEELGHIVAPNEPLREEAAIREVLIAAHQALGVHMGITHAELRLTQQGPCMIELGMRCAGDLIPYMVALATGIDLYVVGASLAANELPALRPSRREASAIRFLYPPYDARVCALSVQPTAFELPWLKKVVLEAEAGKECYLPPRGFLSRLGYIIVTGASINECQSRIDHALSFIDMDLEPLEALPTSYPKVAERTQSRWS
jgi:biotin carboxylase